MSDVARPFSHIIPDAHALVTSASATREGFLQQALAKTQKAASYTAAAHEFKKALSSVSQVDQLLADAVFRPDLLAAAGLSEKALKYLDSRDLDSAVRLVLDQLKALAAALYPTDAAQAAQEVREEVLYRYLLTKGDALGGSLRNQIGASGSAKVAEALLRAVEAQGVYIPTPHRAKNQGKTRYITWGDRAFMFDVSPKLFGTNNIDAILLRVDAVVSVASTKVYAVNRALLADHTRYIACGEIKGGIDPAGADEHWKTAGSAFDRISNGFRTISGDGPKLFFIGAAIQTAMAQELYARLQDGRLSYAANLTAPAQVEALADWLITL